MLAPKLSVLQKAFDRKDLTVVAIYIETCDGVDDHAAEFRRQVEKHKIDYVALDGEAGPIDDPTRERFPWAPHAVLIDARGRLVRTYGHMPQLDRLRAQLEVIVATGLVVRRADEGWRVFRRHAWVEARVEEDGRAWTERRVLKATASDGVTLEVARTSDLGRTHRKEEKVFGRQPSAEDREHARSELEPTTLSIDGRERRVRVFEATWIRSVPGGEARFRERSWIAIDPGVPETLLRRETVARFPDGRAVEETRRVTTFATSLDVGETKVRAWALETVRTWKTGRSEEQVWYAAEVPGHEVRRVRTIRTDGQARTRTSRVVAFGRR